MHDPRLPAALRPLVEAGDLSADDAAAIAAHLPEPERFTPRPGREGFDSTRWSLGDDDALATLAAQRADTLPLRAAAAELEAAGDDVATLRALVYAFAFWDTAAAGRVAIRLDAVEGLAAYHVHRGLRPGAEHVTRLVRMALAADRLRPAELVTFAIERASRRADDPPRGPGGRSFAALLAARARHLEAPRRPAALRGAIAHLLRALPPGPPDALAHALADAGDAWIPLADAWIADDAARSTSAVADERRHLLAGALDALRQPLGGDDLAGLLDDLVEAAGLIDHHPRSASLASGAPLDAALDALDAREARRRQARLDLLAILARL
ncbi:MAG: hypothetical protein R3F60_27090 [bacterium]